MLSEHAEHLAVIDYDSLDPFLFGGSMGLGATLGELPNSFVKRWMSIPPGETAHGARRALFYVWDQIDFMIGAWLLIAPWVRPSATFVAVSFALALALHPTLAFLGYLLGVRQSAR